MKNPWVTKPFTMTKQELDTFLNEESGVKSHIARVFIDGYKDVGEGRLYKG